MLHMLAHAVHAAAPFKQTHDQRERTQRDYNKINAIDYDAYASFAAVHLSGMRTNRNLLVGVYEEACKADVLTVGFRGAQRHSGNVVQVVTLPAKGFPLPLMNGCSEAFMYKFNSTMLTPHARTTDWDHTNINNWIPESLRTDFRVRNGFDFPISFYWQDESQRPKKQKMLAPGQSSTITSFIGHIFTAHRDTGKTRPRDEDDEESEGGEDDTGEMVDFMVVDGALYEFHPANRLETCEIVPGSANSQAASAARFIDAASISCDDMGMRFVEFSHNVWYETRLGLNYQQPALVERVTSGPGFDHRRLPAETYRWLRDWYEEHRAVKGVVEGPVGPCMNQHVAESVMTHLDKEKKDQLSRELYPYLQEWFGGPLELTSIYGVRKYQNGSVLRMHVDTVNTHVVSAIINVDQGVDKDWPLIILDHDDVEHTLYMQPGDMLFYESAKLLHGRPEPFVGSHYDNVFIHYKPKEDGRWNYDWL
jgi:hypothetical protein